MEITRAKQYLDMVESGVGFDEVPVPDGNGDYVPRDVPMTAARHAALAICSSMNVRFNIGENVEEGSDRNDIVDELTEIIQLASGPGPFDINVALALNEQHRTAELSNGGYSLSYSGVDDTTTFIAGTDWNTVMQEGNARSVIVEPKADTLFAAVRSNLATLTVKSPE